MPSTRPCPRTIALSTPVDALRAAGRPVIALAVAVVLVAGGFRPSRVAAQEQALTGWFHTVTIHGPGEEDVTEYWLTDDQGARVALLIDTALLAAHGGVPGLDRQRMTVRGHAAPALRSSVPSMAVLAIELHPSSEAQVSAFTAAGASVSRRWVTVLCRFGDATGVTPHDVAWFEGLVNGTAYPGMAHYWSEASYGAVNLNGSVVLPWRNLPLPRSAYVSGSSFDLDRLAKDCAGAATADISFSTFFGINLMFNGHLPVSVGGTWVLALDGPARYFAVTWIPSWGYRDHGLVAHEMGHGFGFPHSSGPYGQTYDSRWDVMSDWADNCGPLHPTYGCVGTGTIAHHKNRVGWIPASRRFVAAAGTRETITLDRLAQPEGSTSYLMAVIPIAGSTTSFYTVEARDLAGYDSNLPARAVTIHKVDTTREIEAQVVDVDRNRNPNDAAAMWLPGETFSDPANAISVSVVASAGAGFQVTIASGLPVPVAAPDLVVTAAGQPPPTAVRGGRFRVSDTVANQGDGPAPASRMRYYLSDSAGRGGADVLMTGTRTAKALAPGAAASGLATLTVPAITAAGTYFLLTCADDLQAAEESDEANNCAASATTVTIRAPDLVATAVSDPPGAATRGARFAVTDSVQNQGSSAARASRVRYYLSRDGSEDAGDPILGGTRSVPALDPGAISTGTATVTVPSSASAGTTYYLLACADGAEAVGELVETNNCHRSTARVVISP